MLEICFSQISATSDSERLIAYLAMAGLGACGLYFLIRWFRTSPVQPDPWDGDTAKELEDEECTPLCHHCLAPHEPAADFCAQCGAAVGEFTNLYPLPYVFSIGHALRIGTGERFRRSPLTIVGFFVFSFAACGPLALVYWYRLMQNLHQPPGPPASAAESAAGPDGPSVQPPVSNPG